MKNLLFILFLLPVCALAQTTISTSQIRDAAVTYAKIQQIPGLTMFGRSANTTGAGGSITAGLDGQILRRSGTTLAFGALDLGSANATTGVLSVAKLGSGTLAGALTINGGNTLLTWTNFSGFTVESTAMHLDIASDLDIDAGGDVKLNGVAGTSGEFIGNVDGHLVWAVPAGGGGGGTNILNVSTSDVGNVGTGEDVLWTYTLPADSLDANGDGLYIRVAGSSAINGNNKNIKLYAGDDLMVNPGVGNLSQTWTMDCQVIRTGATTAKSNCHVITIAAGQTHTVLQDITETWSGAVVFQLTGEAVSNDDIVKKSVTVTTLASGGGGGGGSGDVSLSDMVASETPSGAVNGINVTYTLGNTPAGFIHVYLDGLLQEEGGGNDYTISGATITMVSAPLTGSKVRVSYIK